MNKRYIVVLSVLAGISLPTMAQIDKELAPEEQTAAVSVIKADKTDRRSAKNIGNSILGEGNGQIGRAHV